MSFSYHFADGTQDNIDFPRMLIGDTVDAGHIFEDSEIIGATRLQGMVWQSSQFYSNGYGVQNLPNPPVSYRRVAATLLDAIASSSSRVNSITQLLDVKLDPGKAAALLRAQAAAFRAEDDEGAFAVIEQVNTGWSLRDRWWKQAMRQSI